MVYGRIADKARAWCCATTVMVLGIFLAPASADEEVVWTWMKGANTTNTVSSYGIQGRPSVTNTPGPRDASATWVDNLGALWLFGGIRNAMSDLWRYDPSTNMWTWMKGPSTSMQNGVYGTQGTPHQDNTPGARHDSVTWVDASGALWLFGGFGEDRIGHMGHLNDLWKYEPWSNAWTWMKGPDYIGHPGTYGTQGTSDSLNVPSSRREAVSWIDAEGMMWLFGGYGHDSAGMISYLNDLWQYDPPTNSWTWLKGADFGWQPGVYGSRGQPNPNNTPGARFDSVSWTDRSGMLWLFGGYACDSAVLTAYLNDLWRYDPGSNSWTWMKGTDDHYSKGVYGTRGVPDDANTPGARMAAVSWTDAEGAMWLFGGSGYDPFSRDAIFFEFSDLWRYNHATNRWTWMSGSDGYDEWGIYGSRGVPSHTNLPGARREAASWLDSAGRLWLFGGYGLDAVGGKSRLNDLWRVNPPEAKWWLVH